MAAKIRAKEILPDAVDTEYLKLYAIVFGGWFLATVGTHLFLSGFPVGGGLVGSLLGIIFGGMLWITGAIGFLVGVVATARKVLLESTREELLDIDRITGRPSAGSSTPSATSTDGETATDETAPANLKAGSSPDSRSVGTASSRAKRPDDDATGSNGQGESTTNDGTDGEDPTGTTAENGQGTTESGSENEEGAVETGDGSKE